jgi:hypothetical protein
VGRMVLDYVRTYDEIITGLPQDRGSEANRILAREQTAD